MVTKNEGGREDIVVQLCLALWRPRVICNLNVLFPCKKSISISAAWLQLYLHISDVMMNRQSRVKVFLSVITVLIVLAHLIDFLIR